MPNPNTPWEIMVTEAMHECTDVFGEGEGAVIFTHVGGEPYGINGIWDAESVQIDPDTGVQILSYEPMISFALSDMEAQPDNGDTVKVRNITYVVKEPLFDGQGTVTLLLYRA